MDAASKVPQAKMKVFKEELTDDEIKALISYVGNLVKQQPA